MLDRSTRPLSLTAEGRLYIDMCRDMLRRSEEFRAALDQLKSEVEGTVRVAAIYSVGLSEMSEPGSGISSPASGRASSKSQYLRPGKDLRIRRRPTESIWVWSAIPSRHAKLLFCLGEVRRWCLTTAPDASAGHSRSHLSRKI